MKYLQEWNVFLLKKLLLSTDEELNQYSRNSMSIPSLMHLTGLLEKDEVDEEDFFKYLFKLASENPAVLTIEHLRISKKYKEAYAQKVGEINGLKHRKQIAGLGSGSPSKNDYIKIDEYCELGKNLHSKMLNGESISINEFQDFLNSNFSNFLYGLQYYVLFDIKIDMKKLKNKLDDYIQNFLDSELIPAQGQHFYSVEKQFEDILRTLKFLSDSYGYKNVILNIGQVANTLDDFGNLIYSNASSYRFYEALLGLEKTKVIVIKDLRNNEAVLSVTSEHLIKEFRKPSNEPLVLRTEPTLSLADKKKLFILEKLKEEWDLTPKTDDEPIMVQAGVFAH